MEAKVVSLGQLHYKLRERFGEAAPSKSTVGNILKGHVADPPIGTVHKIATVLGLALDQVIGITPMPEQPTVPLSPEDVQSRLQLLEEKMNAIERFQRGQDSADLDAVAKLRANPDGAQFGQRGAAQPHSPRRRKST